MPKEDPFVNRAQLLKAIKKYPEIWDSNNKLHMCRSVTSPMWNEIAEQFGGLVPTVKLQSIWSQMKYHYHNLVHRQILHKERFTTKWEHFEPMSFMYSITVAKIVNAASPNAEAQAQPATAPAAPAATAAPAAASVSVPPPPPAAPPSSTITSSQQLLQHQQPVPSSMAVQGRGRPSGSFTWMPQPPPTPQQQQQLQPPPQQQQQHLVDGGHPPDETGDGGTATGGAGPPGFTVFTGLVPPAAVTVETRTTPHVRKPGRPVSMNNSMRGRIIDVIKAHPALWAGKMVGRDQRQGQNRTSAVWKEVAAELGLTPSLVQTRWSIIKQRYVDELQKERHALYLQQEFHSTWEHFERISFMRDILMKKVDEREQTREQIQEIVSEQQQLQNQHMRYHHHHQQQQQQQHQAQQHHHQGQQQPPQPPQQHHHHNHHHHQHHHGQHPDGSVRSAGGGSPPPPASPVLHHHGALCDDGNVDVVGMLPVHPVGRRRVKTESDLEWDPFEMILHVHGAEPTNN